MTEEKGFWSPYVAGFVLGLVLLASFLVTGKGLGASGAFSHFIGDALHQWWPTWVEEHAILGANYRGATGPSWIVLVVLGTFAGGVVSSIAAGRWRWETIRGPRSGRNLRWIFALLGGAVSGVAAQVARGCTSGQALTGGAQLAVGSWVFMFSVFGGAYGLAYFVRRNWI